VLADPGQHACRRIPPAILSATDWVATMTIRHCIAIIAVGILATGCSGGGSGSSSTDPGTTVAATGSMAAKIGASSWHATVVSAVRSADGTIDIDGWDLSTYNFGFKVKATATGTFSISPTCPTLVSASIVYTPSGWLGDCALNGTSGSVTITSYSASGASGVFNFELAGASGTPAASSTLTVSAGTFTVKF
jgi:hypothetical protein